MEADLEEKKARNKKHFLDKDIELADKFARNAKDMYKELIASVLVVKGDQGKENSSLVIIDDFNTTVLQQTTIEMQARLSEENFRQGIDLDFNIMLASDLWRHYKERNFQVIDMLRRSYVVQDIGFMRPLMELFLTGRLRPTKEARNTYFVKAEKSFKNSQERVNNAVIDIYWAVIDAAHAAVMMTGITPPSPKELAEKVRTELVERNLLHKRCAEIVENIYDVAKELLHKKRWEVTGKEFDRYYEDAEFFIQEATEFIEEYHKREKKKTGR